MQPLLQWKICNKYYIFCVCTCSLRYPADSAHAPLLSCMACAVLRRVFGPKRDEVTGEWRKLHNEELNDL